MCGGFHNWFAENVLASSGVNSKNLGSSVMSISVQRLKLNYRFATKQRLGQGGGRRGQDN
jgi:hypothetical protein